MKIDIYNIDIEELEKLPCKQKLPVKKKIKKKDENSSDNNIYEKERK